MKTLPPELNSALAKYIESKQPFIGICLGFQLVFDGSDEANVQKALAVYLDHLSGLKTTIYRCPTWVGIR